MKHFTITPENPKGIYIDLTTEEIAQRQLDEQNYLAEKEAIIAKEAEDLDNKQSALNKLKVLGLNDAEIKAIIG